MKNFKLLLATTAILSTTAMIANAELASNQASVPVEAELVSPISVSVVQGMDFGALSFEKYSSVSEIVATISDENTIEGADYLDTPTEAIVETFSSMPVQLSFPDEVELHYTTGEQSQASYPSSKPTITLSNIHVIGSELNQTSSYTSRRSKIGGTLTITKGSAAVTEGKIGGSFTVTAFTEGRVY